MSMKVTRHEFVCHEDEHGRMHLNIPTVEVVRCRDCALYATDDMGDCCTLHDFSERGSMSDGFCSWGERKVDE